MLRHLLRNASWIMTAIETFGLGIMLLNDYLRIDHHVPPPFDRADNPTFAIFMIVIGAIMLINFVWDFWWYRVRLILISLIGMIWAYMTSSFIWSDFEIPAHPHISFASFLSLMVLFRILVAAYKEPIYKLGIKPKLKESEDDEDGTS